MDVPQYSIHWVGLMKNRIIPPFCIFVLLTLLLPAGGPSTTEIATASRSIQTEPLTDLDRLI